MAKHCQFIYPQFLFTTNYIWFLRKTESNTEICISCITFNDVQYSPRREIESWLKERAKHKSRMHNYQINAVFFCKFPRSLLCQGFWQWIPHLQSYLVHLLSCKIPMTYKTQKYFEKQYFLLNYFLATQFQRWHQNNQHSLTMIICIGFLVVLKLNPSHPKKKKKNISTERKMLMIWHERTLISSQNAGSENQVSSTRTSGPLGFRFITTAAIEDVTTTRLRDVTLAHDLRTLSVPSTAGFISSA